MIPKKLILQGFLSYKNQVEIDFDFLTYENIFGIFGPIGSGKSAILDAICYALFDENYRNLNKNDLIHLDCKKARISFEFEHQKITYRIDKEISTNKKALLYKNNELIVEGVTEVKNRIIQILRLDYDKFTKTVIIPQGTYQELLKNEDYYGLLKDYLGIPDVTIPEKIKIFKNHLKNLVEKKEIEFSNYQHVTQEKIDEFQKLAQKYDEEVKQLTIDKKNFENKHQDLSNLFNDYKIYERIITEEKIHLSNLDQMKASERDVRLYKEFNELFLQKKQIAYNLQRIQFNLHENKNQLEVEKNNFLNIQKILTQLSEKKSTIENKKLQKDNFEQDLKIIGSIIILQNQIKIYQIENEKNKSKINDYEKIYAEKEIQLNKLVNDTNLLISQNEKVDFEAVNNLNILLPKIIEIENKKNEAEKLLKKLKLEICQFIGLNSKSNDDQIFNDDRILNDDQILEFLKLLKQDVEIRLKLSELSFELKEGDPCPLCGSTSHPKKLEYLDKDLLDSNLKKYQNYEDEFSKKSHEFENLSKLYENELTNLDSYSLLTSFSSISDAYQFVQNAYHQYITLEKTIEENNKKISQLKEDIAKNPIVTIQELISSNNQKIENNLKFIQDEKNKLKNLYPEINEQVKINLENQIKSLKSEIESFEKEFNDISKKMEVTQTKIKNLESNIEKYTEELQNFEKQKDECEFKIQSKIVQLDLVQETAEQFIKEILEKYNSKQIEKLERVVNEYHSKTIQIQTQKAEYEKKIAGRTPVDESELKDISEKLVELESQITAKTKEKNEYNFQKEKYEKQLKEKMTIEAELSVLKRKKEIVDEFSNKTKADEFKNFIVELYLDDFRKLVNKNLIKLNQGDFELVKTIENNKAVMKVMDNRNNGQLRSIKSLSGGQSFLAAFSIGLSISEQLKSRDEKSFFFIDEGFGSLDNDTLQLMKQLIFQLRNENRIIGIISHIEELKECITRKISLEKDKEGVKVNYL